MCYKQEIATCFFVEHERTAMQSVNTGLAVASDSSPKVRWVFSSLTMADINIIFLQHGKLGKRILSLSLSSCVCDLDYVISEMKAILKIAPGGTWELFAMGISRAF